MIRHPWIGSPWLILVTVYIVLWLMLFSIKEPTWDAVFYYVYGRSVVFDGDLHFANDYQLSYPTAGDHFESKLFDQDKTQTGRVSNLFAIGSSLLWLPWLSVLRLCGTFIFRNGFLSGYERYFVSNIAMLSSLFGLLAFGVALRLAQGVTNNKIALISAVTLLFTTPLIYYQFREPMYAHTASAFTVALCVFVWWKQSEQVGSLYQGLGLGALIGLAGLVRWQNLAYVLLPLASTILLISKSTVREKRQAYFPGLIYLFAISAAVLALFSLQMSVWKILFGSFITIPQGISFLDWRAPFLFPFLFSSFRGLLPWMPIFLFVIIGLLILCKQKPQLGIPLLLMLLFVVYLNGSTRDWFAGGAYGPRRISGTLAILVVGYGAFLQFLPERIRTLWAIFVGFVLFFHQWILLRFGLVEGIGGRVISMQPEFFWEETPFSSFINEMWGHVPQAWAHPLDFFIFSRSPLDYLLRRQIWPLQHLSTLIFTTFFLGLLIVTGLYLVKKEWFRLHIQFVIALIAVFLAGANLWILFGS